jgi:DNA-binding transcriptional ArsR family regulator
LISLEDVFSSRGRVRVLYVLSKAGELNISEIVRRTSLNHVIAERHLSFLRDVGLLVEKRYGRIRIFKINDKDDRLRAIVELFQNWENLRRLV